MSDLDTDKHLNWNAVAVTVTYVRAQALCFSALWILADNRSELEHRTQQEVAHMPPSNWATFAKVLLSE